jgi:hypothetical protein
VRKFSCLQLFILLAKLTSSSATSLLEIVSLSIFYGIAANFQMTFQEMKPNNGLKNIFSIIGPFSWE